MIRITKNLKRLAWYSFIIRFIQIPAGLIVAKLMGAIFTFAADGNVNIVIKNSLIAVIILLTLGMFKFFFGALYDKKRMLYLHLYKINVYEQFLSNPLNYLFTSENGEAIEKLNEDFTNVTNKTITLWPRLYIDIITILIYSVYICFLSPIVMITLIAISLFQIIPPIIVKKYMAINYEQTRDIEAKITNSIIEGYNGLEIIKLYGLKDWYLYRMKKLHNKYLKIGNRAEATLTAQKSMYGIVDNIMKYGTYAILGIFILLGYCPVDVGVQAIALSTSLFLAVRSLFENIPKFAVSKIAEKRLFSWFEHSYQENESLRTEQILFSNVNYSINGITIFRNLSISIDGSRISLIKGENGAGKTTLIRLIMGVVKNEEGDVCVGGIFPNRITERDYVDKILYLPQEDITLSITAKELIEMSIPDKVEIVLRHAYEFGLHENTINSIPMKNLSGGERKKVLLSLALSSEESILLLDEPTNSLDEDSRQVLKMKLQQRVGGAVIVTHNELFDQIANQVLRVYDGGVIFD